MSDRFFSPRPLAVGEVALTGPDAHHLTTVRRFAPGDRVVLFTGDGNEYPAEVLAAGKKHVTLNVLAVVPADREVGFRLEVAAAMPKGDRGDFLVEKLTELGVTRFVPLVTARTVVQPKGARVENLRRAVVEASKQCGRNVLMRVDPPAAWAEFLRAADLPGRRLVLHPGILPSPLVGEGRGEARGGGGSEAAPGAGDAAAGVSPATPHPDPPPPGGREQERDVIVAVGPEGGFTAEEIAAAVAAGWRPVGLGPRVLRVETAAVAAAAVLATSRGV